MSTTPDERTVIVSKESRRVIISGENTASKRTVLVLGENRLVIILDKKTTSSDRTAEVN